jgi:hypothetical protein
LAIDNLRRIVGATDLPVTIDLEGRMQSGRQFSCDWNTPRGCRSERSHPTRAPGGRCDQDPFFHQRSNGCLFPTTTRPT